MADKISLYILAANRLLREALGHTFKSRADIDVVGSAEQPNAGLAAIGAIHPDVLLINGSMQGFDWFEFIPEARRLVPGTQVVIFGMQEDVETFFRAVHAGVAGYLLSDASASDVVCAVRGAVRGEAACPPRLCRALFEFVARRPSYPSPRLRAEHGLTRREQQILPLIAQGLTNKEIAGHFNLSEQTVKNHIHRILRKVGSEDRLSAVHTLGVSEWQA